MHHWRWQTSLGFSVVNNVKCCNFRHVYKQNSRKKDDMFTQKKKHTCASASHSESSLCSTFSVKPISEISGTSFKFRHKNTTANAILENF